jgi:hypothetical protein
VDARSAGIHRCSCRLATVFVHVNFLATAAFLSCISPVLSLLYRIGQSFLTKRVVPCSSSSATASTTCSSSSNSDTCTFLHELQTPPNSNTCPLPSCSAPAAPNLLGYIFGAEDTCSTGSRWHTSSPLLPSSASQQANSISILLSHLPLHRFSSSCGIHLDSKPISPSFRLYSPQPWSVFSSVMPMQSSSRLLRDVQPLFVLSGDHHWWCSTLHSTNSSADIAEVTVGTFSWLQGSSKPSFGVLLFTNSSKSAHSSSLRPGCTARSAAEWHAVVCPCWLPDNRVALSVYAVFAVASFLWLLRQGLGVGYAIKTWLVAITAAILLYVFLL